MDIVYLITDTLTDLKYLGSKKNWKGENTYWGSPNCKNKRYKKYELQQEWKRNLKSRLETFKFEVIDSYENIPHKELLEIELYYQYKLDVVKSMEYVNAGFAKKGFCGDTMSILTEEGRKERIEHISKGLKESISKLTDEERIKKYGQFGEDNGSYGRKWSDERRKHFSESQQIVMNIPEINNKLRKKKFDSSKMGKYDKNGENNPFFGKHHSEETKKQNSEKHLGIKPVNMKRVQIGDKEFESLASASIETGIKYTTIWHRIKSNNEKYKQYNYV
jgi:hypothetical protein